MLNYFVRIMKVRTKAFNIEITFFSIFFLLMIHLFYSIVLLSMESVRTVDSLGIIQMLIPGILTHNNVNYFDND